MIYLDNAATTRLSPAVLDAMMPYLTEQYGNPSGLYGAGREARAAIDKARGQAAALLGCRADEIFFTSGGSEADNWALTAAYEAQKEKGNHIITTAIEHPAVLQTCTYLARERGARVTYLPVDEAGRVSAEDVARAITDQTILISVMAANNEIGTLQPIEKIGAIARERGILFHTDAVQAYGQVPLSTADMPIDLLSVSGHKLHGPKGTGFLFVRRGVPLPAFVRGGAQEHNRRAGTENVAGIVGLGEAAERAGQTLAQRVIREAALRDYLRDRILTEIPHVRLNGPREGRLPNNVNVSVEFVEGESMLIMLDMQGICVSSGSACASGSLSPSHVLKAIGLSDSLARSAVRLTLSDETTKEELDTAVEAMKGIAARLRRMSPKYEAFRKGLAKAETMELYSG